MLLSHSDELEDGKLQVIETLSWIYIKGMSDKRPWKM